MKLPILKCALAALLGASAFAGTAGAADRTQDARPGLRPSASQNIRVLARFSRCVADRHADHARAILAMDYRTYDYQHELRRLAQANWSCGPLGVMRFGGILFAGGMAEALMRERIQAGALAAYVAPGPARPPIAYRDPTELASLCTVRAAPAEAEAVMRTEPASGEEAAALRAILPHFASCLGNGRAIRVNRQSLRAILALAAYRLSDHQGWGAGDRNSARP